MNEISTNLINNNKKENDISKMILNNSMNNSNIFPDKKFNYHHQNLLSDTLSFNSKLIENEINGNIIDYSNDNIKRHQYILSNETLFNNSNFSSLNHSFQTLSKIEPNKSFNDNNPEKNKINVKKAYIALSRNVNNNLKNSNYINNEQTNMNSLAYHTSFNFRPSKISRKLLDDNEQLNELYNYGESLTKELKTSNDNNTDLLMKYNNLKAKIQVQENKNKELENKIKLLKDEEINIKKANEELQQNIISVKKIIDNNKSSSLKSISESKKQFNLNNEKIKHLNTRNTNLKNIQKKYVEEIKKLQDILNEYKKNDKNLFNLEKYLKNDNKFENIDIQKEIDILKSKNEILQNELKQLKNENDIIL